MNFKYLKHVALAAALSAGALVGVSDKAEAATLQTALMLSIDGSGSISDTDFELQRNAYASALASIKADGSVAIGVLQFSLGVVEEFALQVIDSDATRNLLIAAINGMDQLNSFTAIGDSINDATDDLNALAVNKGFTSCADATFKCLIDVSTDGVNNRGANPDTAADDAILAGVDQVNCLGVGGSADCGFIAGDGSFMITANDFSDFERALRIKLAREGVIDPIPLPAAGWLLIAGVGGLAAMSRRKKKA